MRRKEEASYPPAELGQQSTRDGLPEGVPYALSDVGDNCLQVLQVTSSKRLVARCFVESRLEEPEKANLREQQTKGRGSAPLPTLISRASLIRALLREAMPSAGAGRRRGAWAACELLAQLLSEERRSGLATALTSDWCSSVSASSSICSAFRGWLMAAAGKCLKTPRCPRRSVALQPCSCSVEDRLSGVKRTAQSPIYLRKLWPLDGVRQRGGTQVWSSGRLSSKSELHFPPPPPHTPSSYRLASISSLLPRTTPGRR
jgi:hypothetical protein